MFGGGRQLCASLFTLGKLGRILPPRLCEINTAQLNEVVHELGNLHTI